MHVLSELKIDQILSVIYNMNKCNAQNLNCNTEMSR